MQQILKIIVFHPDLVETTAVPCALRGLHRLELESQEPFRTPEQTHPHTSDASLAAYRRTSPVQ